MDYAYTLQGWIKGVNGSKLGKGLGMGNDGRDVYGYVLGYHQGDYTPIGVSMSSISPVNVESNYPNLYNGNISHILSSNRALENGNMMGYQYQYDQLNRLVGMTAQDIDINRNSWTRDLNALRFKETVNYDPNGNILNYDRNGNGHEAIDLLNYSYENGNNRLIRVKDNASHTPDFKEDVEGEEVFAYDKNGNLVRHSTQNFERNLEWNAYGKVKRVTQTESTLLFGYDAQQNRLKKGVSKMGCEQTDYYIRDAQGNVLSVYRKGDLSGCNAGGFVWQEQHLYGSSRLGLSEVSRNLLGEFSAGDKFSLYKGAKRYELTNHLGNVLSVVSDELDSNSEAIVLSAKDYYPFGMSMPGRGTEGGSYRYGFNGKETDPETELNDFGARFYAANLGRWLSIDPLAAKFTAHSPYSYCLDNPVIFVDPDGREPILPLVGTAVMFRTLLNNSPRGVGNFTGGQAASYLRSLGNTEWSWSQFRPLPTETGFFNLRPSRYIYTEKGGWIDMAHFMFYAGKAYSYKLDKEQAQRSLESKNFLLMKDEVQLLIIKRAGMSPVGEAVQDGYAQEHSDGYAAKHSAYSYEDLPSDKFGADFGANYFDPNSKLSFGKQVENYLNSLGATNPERAPNFNTLPTEEPNRPTRTNNSTNPVFTQDNP